MENNNLQENGKGLSVGLKLLIISGLISGLFVASLFIHMLISERSERQKETTTEINSLWGNQQVLSGPVISVPFKQQEKQQGKIVETTRYAHFMPATSTIKTKLIPEVRYRGLYKVITYRAVVNFEGRFNKLDFSAWNIEEKDIDWEKAVLNIGIPDMRGMNSSLSINWNGNEIGVEPGILNQAFPQSGINAKLGNMAHDTANSFSFSLDLSGSEALRFIPLGKETNIEMQSTWDTPSFEGAFPPKERLVNENGFTAKWKVLELNLNYPDKWRDQEFAPGENNLGVKLISPVDIYLMSERSVKYAILFIALTFLIIFFGEMLMKKRVHAMQYVLVGIALCIFYSLLLALSEHIPFVFAYLLASVAVIVLISAFIKTVFGSIKMAGIMALFLSILYAFLYILLRLEDYSLLMGNIGLFIIIAAIMYVSRKIKWY